MTPTGEGGDGNDDKDGALPDGFVPDGGTDAPIDQLVASDGRFCERVGDASNVEFCDDFEHDDGGPKWGWDDVTTVASSLTRENGIGTNGSNAIQRRSRALPQAAAAPTFAGSSAPISSTRSERRSSTFSFSVKKKSTLDGATIVALGYGASLKYVGASVYTAATDDAVDIGEARRAPSPRRTRLRRSAHWHRTFIMMPRPRRA